MDELQTNLFNLAFTTQRSVLIHAQIKETTLFLHAHRSLAHVLRRITAGPRAQRIEGRNAATRGFALWCVVGTRTADHSLAGTLSLTHPHTLDSERTLVETL
jgi:hypothetical protein